MQTHRRGPVPKRKPLRDARLCVEISRPSPCSLPRVRVPPPARPPSDASSKLPFPIVLPPPTASPAVFVVALVVRMCGEGNRPPSIGSPARGECANFNWLLSPGISLTPSRSHRPSSRSSSELCPGRASCSHHRGGTRRDAPSEMEARGAAVSCRTSFHSIHDADSDMTQRRVTFTVARARARQCSRQIRLSIRHCIPAMYPSVRSCSRSRKSNVRACGISQTGVVHRKPFERAL